MKKESSNLEFLMSWSRGDTEIAMRNQVGHDVRCDISQLIEHASEFSPFRLNNLGIRFTISLLANG